MPAINTLTPESIGSVRFDIPVKKPQAKGNYSHVAMGKGKGSRSCVACFTYRGIIRSLGLCRRCFKEYAKDLGFAIYD
ncbi:ribosomal protein S29 [Ordospora colligata]|uniref:Ribosomal protein S29 n=1 Tax=Ordospora colligata OC4 TaxID=1354746 RepID=A0A0B2ULF3_9MICR|nr:ribosomal protein S29 [Ordospora colligata OC4]KHN69862.1 ribosomal protein S29 [Ordospora colligata OC4]TBU16032.1 ribosomal protein S29 [Ordospora colligata]TBU16245.1 ribosomal protein S29 [Ordospora colligata]TBU18949.1 ribosomal protein S29 [Ordospora colligata]